LGSDYTIYQKELDFFSKYLSVWIAICIVAGTAIGYYFPELSDSLAEAAPSAFIGASNFFELVVAIILFGVHSGVTLAVVVGVLVEVSIMLSLVKIKAKKSKFDFGKTI